MLEHTNGSIESFDQLLKDGHIAEALRLRLDGIETVARHYRQELEAAKFTSASLSLVGLFLSANPLIGIVAGCGFAGYAAVLYWDYQSTRRFYPVPLLRKSVGDLLAGVGLAASNTEQQEDPLEGVIGYVEPELAHEYELIMVAEPQLASYLSQLPGDKRLLAYRHMLRHTRLVNSLKLPSLQDVATALGGAPITSQPKAIKPVQSSDSVLASSSSVGGTHQTIDVTPIVAPAGDSLVPPAPDRLKWIDNFISNTALIWGNQGSGKSWFTRYVTKVKKDLGYRVIVLDPDSNHTEWQGVESYHDFEDIERVLRWYLEELKGRYKVFNHSEMSESQWRQKLWEEGRAISLICEEMTTYTDFIQDSELLSEFVRIGATKSRKQEMPITFVAHNNTQFCLGNIKGLGNLIAKMLQIELYAEVDAVTLQPRATGRGAVKLDGSLEWRNVELPPLENKITVFGSDAPVSPINEDPNGGADFFAPPENTSGDDVPQEAKLDENRLDDARKRLEDALKLPFEDNQDSSVPSVPAVPSVPSFRPDQPEPPNLDSDWAIFQKIRDGRTGETVGGRKVRTSKTKLCQEIFGIASDGGNSMKRATEEYDRIRDKYVVGWIRDLVNAEMPKWEIIEEIWSISRPSQDKFKKKKPDEWAGISKLIDTIADEIEYSDDDELGTGPDDAAPPSDNQE